MKAGEMKTPSEKCDRLEAEELKRGRIRGRGNNSGKVAVNR